MKHTVVSYCHVLCLPVMNVTWTIVQECTLLCRGNQFRYIYQKDGRSRAGGC